MPSTTLTSPSGTLIHHSVAITISLGTVSSAFSRSTKPRAILPCTSNHFSSIMTDVPLPFLNRCCSSTKSPSTRLLVLASKTPSNSFSTWLSNVMPLYFPGSCSSPFLFHIGTTMPVLYSFGILPSCIHTTFSNLPVHLTLTSPAISIISSRTSSAAVAFFQLVHCCFHFSRAYILSNIKSHSICLVENTILPIPAQWSNFKACDRPFHVVGIPADTRCIQ